MSRIFEWVSSNAVIPILWSLFGMLIVGFCTYQTFVDVTKINAQVVAALGVVYGLPSIAITAWQWRVGWQAKKEATSAVQ